MVNGIRLPLILLPISFDTMAMATTSTTTNEKNRKKPTLAQTIDQVMTIKTHTESSKTELSSGGKRPFKVWRFFQNFLTFMPPRLSKIQRNFLKRSTFKKCARVWPDFTPFLTSIAGCTAASGCRILPAFAFAKHTACKAL